MKCIRLGKIVWLAMAAVCVIPTLAGADTATWNMDNDGNWTESLNWTAGGPPNGSGQTAGLTFDITADRVVTLDADQTITSMTIGDSTADYFAYTLSGTSTLFVSGGTASTRTISKPNAANTAHDVISVPIQLQGNVTLDSKATGGVLEISGSIGQDASNRSVTVLGSNATSLNNAAVVILSGANTYAGGTTVSNSGSQTNTGGVLRITNDQALGTGNVTLSGGNNTARLELAGGITVNNNITSIGGGVTSVETNPRLGSFSGNNTWTGTISGLQTGGENYPIHSMGTAPGDFFTISGDIINNRTDGLVRNLRLGGDGNGEVTGLIWQSGATTPGFWSVAKDGAGTWTLTADNTYTGGTTVNHGTLLVNGMHTTGGNYSVGADGRLGGTGNISSLVNVLGTISPGSSPGTLTIGELTLNNSATLEFDLDPADPDSVDDDLIEFSDWGAVNLGTETVPLDVLNVTVSSLQFGGTPFSATGSWLLIDGDALNGTPPSTVNFTFAEGLTGVTPSLDFDIDTGDISLVLTAGTDGDFNGDGFVDAADYVVWRKGLGTIYTEGDYDLWRMNFGTGSSSGEVALVLANVPEPAGCILLVMAALAMQGLRVRFAHCGKSRKSTSI
ncbi:MAG: autotransporter-associated beta strand repeat-containing protein [Pirellulales bacterium]